FIFFPSGRRHTRGYRDWSSDVCSSDLSTRVLERLELRVEQRVHALARLVAWPERVAKRFDDVIGGHAQMRGAAFEHPQNRPDDEIGRASWRERVSTPGVAGHVMRRRQG